MRQSSQGGIEVPLHLALRTALQRDNLLKTSDLLRVRAANRIFLVCPSSVIPPGCDGEHRIGDFVERRKSVRYTLRVPVLFSWSEQQLHSYGGFTREVSPENVYVLCEASKCPTVGSSVDVEVLLP